MNPIGAEKTIPALLSAEEEEEAEEEEDEVVAGAELSMTRAGTTMIFFALTHRLLTVHMILSKEGNRR